MYKLDSSMYENPDKTFGELLKAQSNSSMISTELSAFNDALKERNLLPMSTTRFHKFWEGDNRLLLPEYIRRSVEGYMDEILPIQTIFASVESFNESIFYDTIDMFEGVQLDRHGRFLRDITGNIKGYSLNTFNQVVLRSIAYKLCDSIINQVTGILMDCEDVDAEVEEGLVYKDVNRILSTLMSRSSPRFIDTLICSPDVFAMFIKSGKVINPDHTYELNMLYNSGNRPKLLCASTLEKQTVLGFNSKTAMFGVTKNPKVSVDYKTIIEKCTLDFASITVDLGVVIAKSDSIIVMEPPMD